MPKFEKHLPLSNGQNNGIQNVNTTSTSYVEQSAPAYVRLDTSKYNNATYYFEAVLSVSAGTGYASLFNTAGAEVSGAEVTTTATSATRVRSSAISPTTDTYTERLKASSGQTTTKYSSRIIVIQEAAEITDTETQIKLTTYERTSTSTSYELLGINYGYFNYNSTKWDGSLSVYFEGTLKTSAGTGYLALRDLTAGGEVSNSEITTTSTSYSRVRSSALSLTSGRLHVPVIKNSGAGTTTVSDARIIVQQTGTISKTEAWLLINFGTHSIVSSSYVRSGHLINYTSANWSASSIAWYHDGQVYSDGSNTHYSDIYKVTDASALSGSEISSSATGSANVRSSALTMPSDQDLETRGKSTGGSTFYQMNQFLVVEIGWINISPSASLSPSSSASPSVSPSASLSPSASVSPSASLSPSSSLSASTSPSASASASQSPSNSISPSISGSYTLMSRGEYQSLPSNTNDLTTMYSEAEEVVVESQNNEYVEQTGSGKYLIHQFKTFIGNESYAAIEVELKSDLAPKYSPVYLQVFNQNSNQWETIDSDDESDANINFELFYIINNTISYIDNQKLITCRVYQLAI